MVTLAHETKNYDVEFEDKFYGLEESHDTNSDYTTITVFLEGDDITDTEEGKKVINHFNDSL